MVIKHPNWYTSFDPAGSLGNVHFLIPGRPEAMAGRTAQDVADALGVKFVTLKLLKKEQRK